MKLFSHANREADYARAAMQDFMRTAHAQMRLVSAFEIVNHTLSMALVLGTVGLVLWLWTRGEVGVGAVAAATAMALRLNGIAHWIMWELASLFQNIGTVQDGIRTLSRRQAVVDAPGATPLAVTRGEIRLEHVEFHYGGKRPVIEQSTKGRMSRRVAISDTFAGRLADWYAVSVVEGGMIPRG